MGRQSNFAIDTTPEASDYLLGSDSTFTTSKNFTVEGIASYVSSTITSGTNNYTTSITADTSTGVFTLARYGLSSLTYTFGTAAFVATSTFATASHTHSAADILTNNCVTATELNVANNGVSGQYLTSNGTGGFTWVDLPTSSTNTYLNTISVNGSTVTFTLSDASTKTLALGTAAFQATSAFAAASHTQTLSTITDAGTIASKNIITATELDIDSVTSLKIKNNNVTADELNVSSDGTNGQVLTSDGSGGFTWTTASGNNYYLNGITKSTNTLTFAVNGAANQTYTFGAAAFMDTGTSGTTVALGNHTHAASAITGLGALATQDSIAASSISGTLAPTSLTGLSNNGSAGQLIQTDGDGTFTYVNQKTFLTLADTPSSFGSAGQYLKVNSGTNALEFASLGALASLNTVDASAKITDGIVTFAKMAAADMITSSETIDANNSDVKIPTAAAVKTYVDAQVDTADSITELNDTTISGAANGHFLVHTGSAWVNEAPATALVSLGVTATAAELNIMDGVTATATEINALDGITSTVAELNILDGSATTQATVTLVGTDGVVISDGDVMKQALVSDFDTYASSTAKTLTNKTIDADNNTISNLEVDNLKSGVLDTDISSVSSSDDTIPSAKATKAYIDAQIINAGTVTIDSTSTFTNKTINASNNTLSNITVAMLATGVMDENMNSVSSSHDTIPSALATKSYIDSQLTGSDLDIKGDDDTALSIDLDSEVLDIAGGTGITTSGATNTITVAIDNTVVTKTGTETLTNKSLTAPVLTGDTNGPGSIIFKEDTDNGTNAVTLKGAASTADVTLTLPSATDTLVGKATTDTLTNKTLTSAVLNTGVSGSAILDEDNMSSNSATKIATQQSIKAYVDAHIIDEDDMSSNSATKPASQQSVKAYVDAQIATEDTLAELNDTNISSESTGQVIIYDGTNSWDNKSISGDATLANTGALTLANSGVTAASYGSSSAIPVITIDAKGRITSASTASTSSTLTIAADSGSDDTVTVGTDTLTFEGTTNEIETTVSNNKITIGLPNNVTIAGNLTVSGDTITANTSTITVEDPLMILASGNSGSDAVDIGFYGLYDTSGSQDLYSGLFRDANDSGKWKLFKDLQAAPTTTVNTGGTGYAVGTLVANLEGAVTGNASTATALATARNIGGVSFDGTAAINLPGVNTSGNQDTSGTAAIATTVTVADESSDTSCNVLFTTAATGNLGAKSGTNLTFNSSNGILTATGFSGPITGEVTGNAATATALATARNIGGVSFDGTAAIDLPGVNSAGNQNTSGTAAGLSATLAVASGGTNATSFADKSVIISQDSGADTLAAAQMDGNGEILIGGTSGPAVSTLTAGSNISITNADGGITIASTAAGNSFTTVAVSGQNNVVADSSTDTLTLVAGTNVTMTTDDSADSITINATAGTNTMQVNEYTGNGSTAAYTLATSASSENELLVYMDGVYQHHNTYSVSGTTLTFDTNVPNGSKVEAFHMVSVNVSNVVQSAVAGSLLDVSGATGNVTFNVDLTEASEAAIASGDYLLFLDGGATGSHAKENIDDIATLFAGAGLTSSSAVMAVGAGTGLTVNANDVAVTAAQTGITSIYNTSLKVGRDASGDWVDFGTDSQIDWYVNNSNEMRLESDGDLHVDGDVIAASTTISSDEKLKTNIETIPDALDKVEKIKGVSFDWKKDGSKSAGVIAQDIEKIMPDLVKEKESLSDGEKSLSVNYNGLIGVLVEAVKELSAKVKELEEKK